MQPVTKERKRERESEIPAEIHEASQHRSDCGLLVPFYTQGCDALHRCVAGGGRQICHGGREVGFVSVAIDTSSLPT